VCANAKANNANVYLFKIKDEWREGSPDYLYPWMIGAHNKNLIYVFFPVSRLHSGFFPSLFFNINTLAGRIRKM
jgi:hypothetical protein